MKFKQEFNVGIREIGLKNEMSNYGFLSFLEDIATAHSDTVGYGVKDVFSKKKAWLLIDWQLEVIKRPAFAEKVYVNTSAVSTEKTSFHSYRNFEIYNEDKELVATATSKWILFDSDKNKIVKLNSEILDIFNPEGDYKKSEEKLSRLKEPETYNSIYEYQVKRADIDVNKHMNNLNYLKLAYEALPETVYYGSELNNLRITYKNQIKLGDIVKCFYSEKDGKHSIVVKSEDEKSLHSIIELW